MKLKTVEIDGKTYAETDDKGLPVYVHGDGKETGFDAIQATAKITQLNGEAKTHREAKEAAEAKVAAFEGIDDPEAAKAALQTVANLASGDLKTAAQVQEIKDAAKKAAEETSAAIIKAKDGEIAKVVGERDGLKTALDGELIGGNFARSKFIADKLAIPADIAQATFSKAFKVEDGKLVAYDPQGSKILSRDPNRYLEPASFEEAIEQIVNDYPNKDAIMAGKVGGGGGAGNGGGPKGDGKTITRAEYDRLPVDKRTALGPDIAAKKLTVVDA